MRPWLKGVLVHGFNTWDRGAGTIDRLVPALEYNNISIDKDEGDYGWFGLLQVRLLNQDRRRRVIQRLTEAFQAADLIITFSNGANFATQALHMLPEHYRHKKLVVHIAPALDRDTRIPAAVGKQLVMHTPHDGWVRLSSYLPCHPWGRMGRDGFTANDWRNINYLDDSVRCHKCWFRPPHLRDVSRTIVGFAKEYAR